CTPTRAPLPKWAGPPCREGPILDHDDSGLLRYSSVNKIAKQDRTTKGGNEAHVHRQACSFTAIATGLHHGGNGRGSDLSRAPGALQPAGASVSPAWPEAARPLCHLYGEQRPLSGSLRCRRAVGPLLHLRELLP